MNMKTTEVAKQLEINPKVLSRIAKDLHIPKNDYGHYVFTQLDVKKITDYLSTQKPKNTLDFSDFQKALSTMNSRLTDLEGKLSRKADDVLQYQVLNHRKELEDLHKKLSRLQEQVSEINEQYLHYGTIVATKDPEPVKTGFFKSFLK